MRSGKTVKLDVMFGRRLLKKRKYWPGFAKSLRETSSAAKAVKINVRIRPALHSLIEARCAASLLSVNRAG
jgi:hypothetical protein